MDFKKIFGSGKKEPFRVPREVAALRSKIDSEMRENFPNLERYKELAREAETVYRQLSSVIVLKEYAQEAAKVQDEIRKKMDALSAKIKGNISGESAVHGKDYVENIDYLERKNIRNHAKTLFTEFLEAHDAFMNICKNGRSVQSAALDPLASTMVRVMGAMNEGYFKVHRDDNEIRELRYMTLEKISNLDKLITELAGRLEEQRLKTAVEKNLKTVREAAQEL